jgi:hypothetical protein
VIAGLVVLALAPSAASAARCQAPPGTSGIDQYCEMIPGPAGPRTPDTAGPSSPARGGVSPVPSRARSALGRAGKDGAAVVGLANSGGTQRHGTQQSKRGSPPGTGAGGAKTPSSNPLSAVSSAAQSGATLSPGLPLALIALALLAAGYGWVRYRARRRVAASGSGEPVQ